MDVSEQVYIRLKSATFAGGWIRVPLPAPSFRHKKAPEILRGLWFSWTSPVGWAAYGHFVSGIICVSGVSGLVLTQCVLATSASLWG